MTGRIWVGSSRQIDITIQKKKHPIPIRISTTANAITEPSKVITLSYSAYTLTKGQFISHREIYAACRDWLV